MKKIIVVLFVLVSCGTVHAQSAEQVDAKMSGYLKRIQDARSDTSDKRDDMLGNANDELSAYFGKVKREVLLTGEFPKSKKDGAIDYVTSDDKKLRMYDWDSETGGTMHFYNDIAVYKTGSGIKMQDMADTAVEGDPGGYYTSIDEVHTNSGKTVYIVHNSVIGSTRDRGEGIAAYEIAGDKLVPKPFFRTKTKLLSEISYGYDVFVKGNEDRDFPFIHLSGDKKELLVPVVKEDGSFTKGNLVYEFDGEEFVFKGKK